MTTPLHGQPVNLANPDAGAYFTPAAEIPRRAPDPASYPGQADPRGLPNLPPVRYAEVPAPHAVTPEAPGRAPPLDPYAAPVAHQASVASMQAAQGAPVAQLSGRVVEPDKPRKNERVFVLEEPVDIEGTRYERFVLHRLKWGEFEEALGAAIRNDKPGQSSNQIMQARICRVPIDVIQELDWMDGARLAAEVDDMYPLDRLGKVRATGAQS